MKFAFKIYDFDKSDIKFNYQEYEKEKQRGGDKEYLLTHITKQKWARELIDFHNFDTKVILIKNCPLDKNIPLSPIEHGYLEPNKYSLISDLILTFHKVMNIIPYSYQDENKGKLFRSLVPVKKEENMIGSYGSKNEFKYHSDNPTYKIYPEYKQNTLNAPEFLSLFCIRGQDKVHTNVVLLNDILKQLSNSIIETLQENIFIVNTPDSFDKYHEVHNVCVISKYKNKFYTRFDYHNIKGMNDKAQLALSKFIKIMEKTKVISHSFESGDFLIFKNQEVLHSRESFEAPYNGQDRWLLRVYGASNIGYLNHKEINKKELKCI